MAGISWIKLETTFPSKPVVFKLRRILNLSRSEVIGNLIRVLCWADGVTSDGALGGMTVEDIDEVVSCDGFGAALVSVGWLTETDGELSFCEWDMHNGENAKRRALNARAANRYRTKPHDDRHQNVIKKDDDRHQSEPQNYDLNKIRIDKNKKDTNVSSKEEVRETVSAPDNSGDTFVITKGEASYRIPKDRGNDRFLDAYGKQPKVVRAFQVEWATALEREDPELLIACAQICRESMTDDDYRFQLAPENWLADRRYDQFRRAAKQAVTHNRTTSFVLAPLPGEE